MSELILAQPLEFYDYADSVNISEMRVHHTHSDSGWISIGIGRDSLLVFSKYDYCGHKKYQKAFTISTFKLSGLNTSIETNFNTSGNSDTVYVSCILDSNNYRGLYCLEFYPYSSSTRFEKIFTIDSSYYYSNVKIISNKQEKLVYFNAGPYLDSLTGYIMRTDQNYTSKSRFKFSDHIIIRDITMLPNNEYFLTLGNRLIGKLNNNNLFDYVYQLDSFFKHFDQNLSESISGNVAFIGDYKKISNDNTIALLKFNTNSKLINFSNNLVRYNPRLNPRIKYFYNFIDGINENYIISHLTNKGPSNTMHANSLFVGNTLSNTQGFSLSNNYFTKFLDIDYLPAENNFILNGEYQDTQRLFQTKLNKRARMNNCNYISIPNSFKVDSIDKKDTFSNLFVETFLNPITFSTISVDTFTYSYKRDTNCKYFDFIIDTSMMPYCDGNIDTTFILSVKSNDPQSIDNPFVRYLWKDDNSTEKTNTIKWDPKEEAYLSKYVIITYCDEVDTSLFTTIPVNCPPSPKLANVFAPGDQDPINKLYGIVLNTLDSIRIKEVKWSIFNRWGQKIYTSTSAYEEWDGNYKGEPAPMDTYSVVMEVADIYNKTHVFKKMFTLIR